MTQNPVALPNTGTLSGVAAVNDINAANLTEMTLAAGASAPTTSGLGISSTAGIVWHDTSTNTLKIRDQADANWMVIASIDETNKWVTRGTPISLVGANQNVGAANHPAFFQATAAITFNLALTTSLWAGFSFEVWSGGGQVSFTPNASDSINGASAGSTVTVPGGQRVLVVTDGAGNWYIKGATFIGVLLSSSGYEVCNDGKIDQWLLVTGGSYTAGVTSSVSFSWPVTFPNGVLNWTHGLATFAAAYQNFSLSSITTSRATASFVSGGSGSSWNVYLRAVGY